MEHIDLFVAEFIGTTLLILLGNGVVANVLLKRTAGNSGGWIVITAGWGIAVALAVTLVGRVSGAHINPAVTLSLASIGQLEWNLVPVYVGAQMLGAMLGATLVWLSYLPHWRETEDGAAKRACFCTMPAIPHTLGNFLAEFFGTFVLILVVLAIGANTDSLDLGPDIDLQDAFSAAVNPLIIGLLVFGIGLSLGGPTGYAINPARDLGPRIAYALLPIPGKTDGGWWYAWVPVVAPLLGGVAAALLFNSFEFMQVEPIQSPQVEPRS